MKERPADLVVQLEPRRERLVRVVRGVQSDEQAPAADGARDGDAAPEERREVLLGVLAARAQLVGELVAEAPDGAEDRRVAVDPVVREADPLLAAVVVHHHGHVDVERDVIPAGGPDGAEVLHLREEFGVRVVHPLPHPREPGDVVEALAERRLGRDRAPHGVGEEVVPLVRGDVAEGRLAEGHQRDCGLGDGRVRIGLAGDGLQRRLAAVELPEGRDAVEDLLRENNPRIAIDILRRFFYNHCHNLLVSGVFCLYTNIIPLTLRFFNRKDDKFSTIEDLALVGHITFTDSGDDVCFRYWETRRLGVLEKIIRILQAS